MQRQRSGAVVDAAGPARLVDDDDGVLHHISENLDPIVRSNVDLVSLYFIRRFVCFYSYRALCHASEQMVFWRRYEMEFCTESGFSAVGGPCRFFVRLNRQYRRVRPLENGIGDRHQFWVLFAGNNLGENKASHWRADDSEDHGVYLDDRDGIGAAERLMT